MTAAARLKRFRKRHNMSREEVAIAVGVAANTVWTWERGSRNPSGPAAKMLEQLYAQKGERT